MHPLEVIRHPLITEKGARLQQGRKYLFKVDPKANKRQVKEAVELAFKVKVSQVNILTMHGKPSRYGRKQVEAKPWKKAVVTLTEGHKIEFFEGV